MEDRVRTLKKRVNALEVILIGYLVGHFLGCLLFP